MARGGEGGYGNAHFKTSQNQAPSFAEKGLTGEHKRIKCELKLLAEVGLIGLPNAGKSTFLKTVTAAHPKVGAYPFTTLAPHLGVSENGCLIADIPGLIKGAAQGKGLGHEFLRHVERNLMLLHLIDSEASDVSQNYQQIITELKAYKPSLLELPQLVALTKIETITASELQQKQEALAKLHAPHQIYTISSHARLNIKDLLKDLKRTINQQKIRRRELEATEDKPVKLPIFKLEEAPQDFKITQKEDIFIIHGQSIERFAQKTDFDNYQACQRLLDIMQKTGITHQLMKRGYRDELIFFGDEVLGSIDLQLSAQAKQN